MTRIEAIVHELQINRQEDRVYFQVPLPLDAVRILGVETAGNRIADSAVIESDYPDTASIFRFNRSKVAGELSLFTLGTEHLFYKNDVVFEDNNPAWGQTIDFLFPMSPWTHGAKRTPLDFAVSGKEPIIEGFYKDNWGTYDNPISCTEKMDIVYTLKIYIWIERKY